MKSVETTEHQGIKRMGVRIKKGVLMQLQKQVFKSDSFDKRD